MSHSDRMAYVADKLFDIVDGKIIRCGKTYKALVELKTIVIKFDVEEFIDEVDDGRPDEGESCKRSKGLFGQGADTVTSG
jgi:hypothetical protein